MINKNRLKIQKESVSPIIDFLNSERPGFSGTNHVLIAIMLFFLLLMIPVEPFSSFLHAMTANGLLAILTFFIICGAALLADMDLEMSGSGGGSYATHTLGFLGSIISVTMVTMSSVMTSIFHGKRDVRPNTQHRFFWHTMLIPLVIFLLISFFAPENDNTVYESFMNNGFESSSVLIILLIGICIYTGSILLLRKINKLSIIRIKPGMISTSLMALTICLCIFCFTNTQVKFLGYCVALGYFFHLFADMFADGGIPALFPITGIFGRFWMRIKLSPLTVITGSTVESLLKIVFAVIDVVLGYYVLAMYFNFLPKFWLY